MEKAKNAMMGNWINVKNLMNHKTMYTTYTDGQIETFLGDRLRSKSGGSKSSTQAKRLWSV